MRNVRYSMLCLLISLCVNLWFGCHAEDEPIRTDRLLHLPMNENGGLTAYDLNAYHLHATLFNTTYKTDPTRGVVLQFNGESSYGVSPHNDAFDTQNLSLAAWILPESFADNVVLLAKAKDGNGLTVGLDADGHLTCSIESDTVLRSEKRLNKNQWNHIALIFEGNSLHFYINGDAAGAGELSSSIPYMPEPIVIGAAHPIPTEGPFFHGAMSDLRLLNRPVDAGAVAGLRKATTTRKRPKVLTVPIHGTIGEDVPFTLIEGAANEAKEVGADVLLLDVDSPGGLVSTARKTIDLFKKLNGIQTAAYISGKEHKGAISAAAVISLCTQRIIMRPGCTIGAATAITVSSEEGVQKAEPKFQAIWRSHVRSGATAAGHAPTLGAAMVESDVGVGYALVDGTPHFGTEDELAELESRYGDKYKYVKSLADKGQILALTGTDAREAGVIFGTANDLKQVLTRLGIEDAEVLEFSGLKKIVEAHKKQQKKLEKQISKAKKYLRTMSEEATMIGQTRPDVQRYTVRRLSDAGFIDGGKKWKQASKSCMDHCQKYRKAASNFIKLANRYEELGIKEQFDMDVIENNIEIVESIYDAVKKHADSRVYVDLNLVIK